MECLITSIAFALLIHEIISEQYAEEAQDSFVGANSISDAYEMEDLAGIITFCWISESFFGMD